MKPQLRSTNNCQHVSEWYKSRSQQEVKETSVLDNNLRRGQPLALPVAQTCLWKLKTEGQNHERNRFYVAGKSVDMTDINQGHNIVN